MIINIIIKNGGNRKQLPDLCPRIKMLWAKFGNFGPPFLVLEPNRLGFRLRRGNKVVVGGTPAPVGALRYR